MLTIEGDFPSLGISTGADTAHQASARNAATRPTMLNVRQRERPLYSEVRKPTRMASRIYCSAGPGAAKMAYWSEVLQWTQSCMTVWPNLIAIRYGIYRE